MKLATMILMILVLMLSGCSGVKRFSDELDKSFREMNYNNAHKSKCIVNPPRLGIHKQAVFEWFGFPLHETKMTTAYGERLVWKYRSYEKPARSDYGNYLMAYFYYLHFENDVLTSIDKF